MYSRSTFLIWKGRLLGGARNISKEEVTHEKQVKRQWKTCSRQTSALRASLCTKASTSWLKSAREPQQYLIFCLFPYPVPFSMSSLFLGVQPHSHEIFNALAGASGLHQQPFFHASPKRSSQKNHSSPRHMEFSETLPGFELTTHEGDALLTQRKEPKAQTTVFLYGSSGHLERW